MRSILDAADSDISRSETIGSRLESARAASNLTTAQVARRLGVTTNTLQNWESDRSEPRANRLIKLAGILNVSPSWILMGGGEGPSGEFGVTQIRQALREVTVTLEDVDQLKRRLEKAVSKLEQAEAAFNDLVEEIND